MDEFARWVRTIGVRASWPCTALILVTGAAAHAGWLQGAWLWGVGVIMVALVMTMPFAVIWAHVPGETFVELRARDVRQARNRAGLAAAGLTPEQYIATIPAADVARKVEAAERFGVELTRGRVASHSEIRMSQ